MWFPQESIQPCRIMIRRLSFLSLFACLLLSAVPTAHAQQDRIALITDVKGTVEVAREGSTTYQKAEWGAPLFEGDKLRTGEDAEAVVLFSSNDMLTVQAGNTITVSVSSISNGSLSGPVKAVDGDLMAAASDLTLHRAGEGEIAVLGGLRNSGGSAEVLLGSPRNTRISTSMPDFSWQVLDEYDTFTVTVRTETEEIWSVSTTETALNYPSDLAPLTPGESYFWQVTAEGMMDEVSSPMAGFEVLSAAAQEEVEQGYSRISTLFSDQTGSMAEQFMIGSMLVKNGLYADAIGIFESISDTHPSASMTYEIMGKLYYEMGMKDEAVRALQTAIALH